MLLIFNKKICLILFIIIILSTINAVSANEDNISHLSNSNESISDYYVSPEGSDEEGIGTFESPFLTIDRAVNIADNNSKIILKDGTYSGNLNTNINIDKYLTIEGQSNNVTINGENKNYFFKINKGSSLILNNIKFINGYTNSFSQLGVINNQGELLVNNTSFNRMNSLMSTIYNDGNLTLINTIISNSKSENMAKSITNIADCTIINSKLNDAYENDRDLPTVYNFKNINIINSQLTFLGSNDKYEESIFNNSLILIENSTITLLEIEKAKTKISNSKINLRFSFENSEVTVENTKVIPTTSPLYNTLSIFDSNFTAIHSIFAIPISSGHTNINITYSAILSNINGGGDNSYIYAPYNWWGINSKPSINYFKNKDVKNWAIAVFKVEDGNQSVGTNSKFITSFKWYDGNNTYDLNENEYLPERNIKFESQNGRFLFENGVLTKSFDNYLIGNTLDCTVYSKIDNQELTLTIGKGYSAYNYFVAPWGHDGPEDGNLESPYKSLQYALSHVVDGNTICLLEGIHNGNANSNVEISKNITIIGLGNVTLLRVNGAYIFKVVELGNVKIKNIKFSTEVRDYDDNLIKVQGGKITIENCTFNSITTNAIIETFSGANNNGIVEINHCKFFDIKGSVVDGIAKVYIQNSSFEKISNFYSRSGLENYNAVFTLQSSIEIYNSIFKENMMGIITLHPYTYSTSKLQATQYHNIKENNRYAYIENTKFLNNNFGNIGSYTSIGIGLDIHDSYGTFNGYINNCTFKNNTGKIAIANWVNSSIFTNNNGEDYSGKALIQADLINNSIFTYNVNRYVDYNNVSYGEGIVSADTILYSTFIKNSASFGGAVSNSREIHYCVFINNTAIYSGNDIYSYSGDVDYSSNWWGDNQKPDENKIYKFLGNLKISNWIIMTFTSYFENVVEVSLNNVIDDNKNISQINVNIPTRPVYFMIDTGNITPKTTYLLNNVAYANLTYDLNSTDFNVSCRVDNQILELNLRNTNTKILIEDVIVKGNDNKFNVELINANGFHLANQTLTVQVSDLNNKSDIFTINTNKDGYASFIINYPIGKYDVLINYNGNGYYEKSKASAKIEVVKLLTKVTSYNYTYYGKNNLFYGILQDEDGKNLVNYTLRFTITSKTGESRVVNANTNNYGRSEIILNLPLGEYDVKVDYLGDSWYSHSSNSSHLIIKSVNTTVNAPNSTLYGQGNLYNITLKDIYGTPISGENIIVSISQGNLTDNFIISTNENGIGSLSINYLPGTYNVKVNYKGDSIYGSSQDTGTITIKKVLTIVSGFHYKILPLNGIYSVILTDMYGNQINNGTITLNCYQGKLVKTYTNITNPDGEALFVIDLDEGTYLTTIDYDGNIWYSETTNAATIVVSKDAVLESISLNASDLVQYYGENKFFTIKFNDPNAYKQYGKTITVSISNENWHQTFETKTDAFGLARLQIKLNPGEYNITYKYSNPYYNIYGSGSNKIIIYKMPVTLSANDMIINLNESRMFNVVVKDINNKAVEKVQVNIVINGNEYEITTNDKGIASLPLDLNVGEYIAKYSINNPNYIYSSDSKKILVVDTKQTSTQIIADDISDYEDNLINFTAKLTDSLNNGISYNEITLEILTVNGKSVKNITQTTDANGNAMFKFSLENGKYRANLKFDGNDIYLRSTSINTINIESKDNRTKTLIYTDDVVIFNNQNYSVTLRDENGLFLSDKDIVVKIGNETYNLKTNNQGKVNINIHQNPGIYDINIVFNGDLNYKSCYSSFKLYISSEVIKLYAPNIVKYYRNGTQFIVLLINSSGKALSNKIISIKIENNVYNYTTDENGLIKLDADLKPGHYDVECSYYDEASKEYIYNKTTIDVLTTILGQNEVKYYGDSPYLTITFLNGIGKGINNTDFVISIDGKNYYGTTDDEGRFYFDLNLNVGNHIISVTNPYDGLTESYKLNILTTIKVTTLTKVLGDGQYYISRFYDKNNTPLINSTINIIINGINHTYTTDEEGKVKLSMEFAPKNYLVTAINTVTGEYVENTIKVLSPISENKDLKMYFNSKSYFKVRIIGINGTPLGKGETVKFNINGKIHSVETDDKGYASVQINLKAKTYTITTDYKGYKVSNKIIVKPVLTAKNISKKAKKIKFKAKLVDCTGHAAKGKKITFKFKNKKYKAKTNLKGIACIKLTLKSGKYKIYSIYGKSKIKNTIKIKN